MIRLTKAAIPPILAAKAAEWTQALLLALRAGGPTEAQKGRYRHPQIKAALIQETAGKCAYCESKLRHITHGDVEHITPKSSSPEKSFAWENLTLACDICNENKSDYAGELADPYVIDPEDHFLFLGPVVVPRPGSDVGLITEKLLRLNRSDLIERRLERLLYLNAQLNVIVRVQDHGARSLLLDNMIAHESRREQEYAALSRAFMSVLKVSIPGL